MKRRDIIRSLTILPFAGYVAPQEVMGRVPGPLSKDANIYASLGVDTIINCRGTFTIIGGSIERPEVLDAMRVASGRFVQYDELAFGVGKRLADLTGAEWGMVSSGCAGGMKHVTTACVAGGNPEKLIRIPDLTGLEKTEVIIPGHSRNVYDHAIRNVGVKIITVETPEEFERALSTRTAMIYLMTGHWSAAGQPLSLEVIAGIAGPRNVPILADAAAEDLTIPNVHLKRGATVVAYSGGKAICGPQCAGLLLGRKDILMSAWQASSPHHGPGRDNKVGKEEMLGMVAAVEAWTTRDHDAEWGRWLSWLDHITGRVTEIAGVTTSVQQPDDLNNRAPVLEIKWDPNKLFITGEEVAEDFARNKPRIAIGSRSEEGVTSINITPNQMQPGEEKIVATRVYDMLTRKRSPRSEKLAAPAANLSGHWDVTVNFFTSESNHTFFIEQDGNWLQGTHRSDFSVQELAGMIEGNEVKLHSRAHAPGDSITFLFSGTASGDAISGSIYLGEYLTARFKASRKSYKAEHKRITIPGGPPLAT